MGEVVTAVENFVLLGSLTAGAAFLCAAIVRAAVARRLWSPHPVVLTRVYAVAVAAPPVVSLWLVSAALLPEWWLGRTTFEQEHAATTHSHLHLLTDVTAALER